MPLAETAQLAVNLSLGGNFGPGLASAEANLGRFNATATSSGMHTGTLGGAFGRVSTAAGKMGGALSHAGGQLKGLLTGPLGLLGLGGGLLAVGGFFESALHKTEDFGLALEKLTGLTGESAQAMGALILLADKYGISSDRLSQIVGFTEKTLGKLNETTAKSVKVGKSAALQGLERIKNERLAAGLGTKRINELIREQKARDALNASNTAAAAPLTKLQALDSLYGVSLVDNTGKVKNFSQVLGAVADYYTGTAAQSTKAALAAQVFGRGYAALLPILLLGSKGIRDQEQAYKDLGLQLGTDTTTALTAFRGSMRQLGEAISIVQLQLGLAFAPLLTKAANSISLFLEHGGAKRLVAFFRDAATAASHAGGVIIGFAHKAIAFWNAIPAPFRDLLLKGVVADRTVKFLFGFSPIGSAVGGIEKLIASAVVGGLASGIAKGAITAGLGKFFVQPVWVTNPGFGGLGGAAGAAEGAAGGGLMGLLGAAGIAAIVLVVADQVIGPIVRDWALANGLAGSGSSAGKTDSQLAYERAHQAAPATSTTPFHDSAEQHAADTVAGALVQLRAGERADWAASIAATRALTATMRNAPWLSKLEDSWRRAGQTMHDKIKAAIAGLTGPHAGAAAAFLGSHLGQAGFGAGGLKQAEEVLAVLKKMPQTKDIVAAERRITAQLPRLKTDAKDLAAAEKEAQSSDPKNTKLDKLNGLMADLKAHGDRTAQKKLGDIITAVKKQKVGIINPINVHITVPGSGGAGATVMKRVKHSSVWIG